MRSINFDDGLKSFAINGDESRVIRFNPRDLNMKVRAKEATKRISEWQAEIKDIKLNADGTPVNSDEGTADVLENFDAMLRHELNYIFNADVYDIVFDGQSPLCIVGKDKYFLFEAFLFPAMQIIEEEIDAFARDSQARMDKYTAGYHKWSGGCQPPL